MMGANQMRERVSICPRCLLRLANFLGKLLLEARWRGASPGRRNPAACDRQLVTPGSHHVGVFPPVFYCKSRMTCLFSFRESRTLATGLSLATFLAI